MTDEFLSVPVTIWAALIATGGGGIISYSWKKQQHIFENKIKLIKEFENIFTIHYFAFTTLLAKIRRKYYVPYSTDPDSVKIEWKKLEIEHESVDVKTYYDNEYRNQFFELKNSSVTYLKLFETNEIIKLLNKRAKYIQKIDFNFQLICNTPAEDLDDIVTENEKLIKQFDYLATQIQKEYLIQFSYIDRIISWFRKQSRRIKFRNKAVQ